MYTEHFGLNILPFENVPDPVFFFDQGDFHRVLQRMRDSMSAGRGLLAVAGPIGAGKTTLSQKLMHDVPPDTKLIWLAEPTEKSEEILLFIAQELGLSPANTSRVFIMNDIRKRLLERYEENSRCLMIIDESHLMTDDVLEGIRLLNNLEQGSRKLIQIILLGQQELVERISRPEMEAFKQRIAGMEIVGRMSSDSVQAYIDHRLHVAGCNKSIFTDEAIKAITLSTGGIPRLTNSLCDRSLRHVYEQKRDVVGPEDVHEAADELGLAHKSFHYIVELRAAREKMTSPDTAAPSAEKEVKAHSGKESSVIRDLQPDLGQPRRETASVNPEPVFYPIGGQPAQPGLGIPLLLLASSLCAFFLSIWFYGQRMS